MSGIQKIIKTNELFIPINILGEENLIEIHLHEHHGRKKLFEFKIPVLQTDSQSVYPFDYYARFPVKKFTDKTIILTGEVPEVFLNAIQEKDDNIEASPERPSIHFTARHSWINDPNGLHFRDGMYHLYYQYNPFHIKWNNMSWGHATSRDLLHWKEQDAVLFPDENGMMFSGCAIINERGCLGLPEDASIFFYTAAGGITPWSFGKPSTQRIAYSLDGGNTLTKTETGVVACIEQENRDPKVFWHEKTKSFIMCLWLKENEFAILRSVDLKKFEISHRFSLDQAWECPDLFCLKDANGEEHWVFWSADGYYYFGTFDGYTFCWDGVRHQAYMNQIPYAAQTISGITDRIISIPWLRLEFYQENSEQYGNKAQQDNKEHKDSRYYTGAMGIPRELTLYESEVGFRISQNYVRELWDNARWIELTDQIGPKPLLLERMIEENEENYDFTVDFFGNLISYSSEEGMLKYDEQKYYIGEKCKDFSFLLDDVVFEVTANHGIITGAFYMTRKSNEILIKSSDRKNWKFANIKCSGQNR